MARQKLTPLKMRTPRSIEEARRRLGPGAPKAAVQRYFLTGSPETTQGRTLRRGRTVANKDYGSEMTAYGRTFSGLSNTSSFHGETVPKNRNVYEYTRNKRSGKNKFKVTATIGGKTYTAYGATKQAAYKAVRKGAGQSGV